MIITNAYNTNTPEIISFMKRLSCLTCIKFKTTVATFTLAMARATVTEKAPRCQPVTKTEIKVSVSSTIRTMACDVKLDMCVSPFFI